jgi:hypothetical protein
MLPRRRFCHNPDGPDRGRVGQDNIGVSSQKERRSKCRTCGKIFTETKGTPFYHLRPGVDLVTVVVTLLGHGCPIRAVVAAFGFDERTVADWQARAGEHCERVHDHLAFPGQVDLQHVQADEIRVKMVGRRVWMAIAPAVSSRLWLGGVISPRRDRALSESLVGRVRAAAWSPAILVCVDGLTS